MRDKFHPNLKNIVSTMSNNECACLIYSTDFLKTKNVLDLLKIEYKEYEFVDSFYVKTSYENLIKISQIESVNFLVKTTKVSSQIYNSKNICNLRSLTENRFFGRGVNVAFIDTGIYPHLDFIFPQNRIIKFVDLLNKKTFPYDDNGHGTFVASICAGSGKRFGNKYSGVAPEAKIIMIKALDKNGETDSNKILEAMEYIYKNKKKLNIGVVCMSFGADDLGINDPLKRGAMKLWESGIVVVVAGGNSGPENSTIKSPGTNKKIITVGGLDATNIEELKVADFSSRGPVDSFFKPDLIAPSVDLIGANNKKFPYIKMSGTSVATPFVAGICAIIREKFPHYSPDKIKYFLINNCIHIDFNKNNEGFGYIKFK